MAAELKERYGVPVELIEGGGGIYDIHVNDQLVFSKHRVNRFPDEGETAAAIDELLKTS